MHRTRFTALIRAVTTFHMQVLSACLKSFAHGANDTANAAGPFAAVQALYLHGLNDCTSVSTPIWVLAFCGAGIVLVRPCLCPGLQPFGLSCSISCSAACCGKPYANPVSTMWVSTSPECHACNAGVTLSLSVLKLAFGKLFDRAASCRA